MENICRVCMETSGLFKNIFDERPEPDTCIAEMIAECAGLHREDSALRQAGVAFEICYNGCFKHFIIDKELAMILDLDFGFVKTDQKRLYNTSRSISEERRKESTQMAANSGEQSKAVMHRPICGLGDQWLKLPNYTFEGNSKLLGFARRINPELRRETMVCMECFKSLEKIYKLKAQYHYNH